MEDTPEQQDFNPDEIKDLLRKKYLEEQAKLKQASLGFQEQQRKLRKDMF